LSADSGGIVAKAKNIANRAENIGFINEVNATRIKWSGGVYY
jgi:hypothetical protein